MRRSHSNQNGRHTPVVGITPSVTIHCYNRDKTPLLGQQVSSVSTPVSVHKDSLQNSDASKKSKMGSSSSSGHQLPGKQQQQQQPPASAPPNSHSTRFPFTTPQSNNLVLDLYSVRQSPPQQQPQPPPHTVCSCALAPDSRDIDPTAIEESILETFQRIDAQHVSNSYEVEGDEQKMSIIENPLSETVMEADGKTIPFHKVPERVADGLYGKPVTLLGSEMVTLNNRVDELTKQLQSLEHSVASDIRLILTLLQQQFNPPNPQSSGSSVAVEPSGSDLDASDSLDRAPQRSLSIPYSTVIAHRKSPSMDLSRSWAKDQHSHIRSSSESHRLHSHSDEPVRRLHSSKESDACAPPKRHSALEPFEDPTKKSADSSKSLSDGNVTRLPDPVPVRSVSQPLNVSQDERSSKRVDRGVEEEDGEETRRDKRDGKEMGEPKR